MWCICAPVSDDPTPSMMMALGRTSIKRCLTNGVSNAPPLATTASDDTSAIPFSMAATKGRAIASPTTVTTETFSRSMVRTTSSASKWSTTVGKTTDCPLVSAVITLHWAAPWISGGRIINLVPGPSATLVAISSTESAGSPVMMFRPPKDVMKMSCWRHSTPFGIPVVPPVYRTYRSSGECCSSGDGSCAPSAMAAS